MFQAMHQWRRQTLPSAHPENGGRWLGEGEEFQLSRLCRFKEVQVRGLRYLNALSGKTCTRGVIASELSSRIPWSWRALPDVWTYNNKTENSFLDSNLMASIGSVYFEQSFDVYIRPADALLKSSWPLIPSVHSSLGHFRQAAL